MTTKKDDFGNTYSSPTDGWVVPLEERTQGLGSTNGEPQKRKLTGGLGPQTTIPEPEI